MRIALIILCFILQALSTIKAVLTFQRWRGEDGEQPKVKEIK